jgi:hypothetical protein
MTQSPETSDPFAAPAGAPPIPVQHVPQPRESLVPSFEGTWAPPAAPSSSSTRGPLWLLAGVVAVALLLGAGVTAALLFEESSEQPTAVHLAEPGEPALIQVPGYTYADAGAREIADVQEEVDALHEVMPGFYTATAVHEVERAGAADIWLTQLQISTEVLESPDFVEDDALMGVAGGMASEEGATVSTKTIGPEKVARGTVDGDSVYAWFHEGVLTMAAGNDDADTLRFVEAYIAEAHK